MPNIVFFKDPNIMNSYRNIKELQTERRKADSRNSIHEIDMSQSGLKNEIKSMRKARKKDVYSLVPEVLSRNPFMTKILKSSEFSPEPGVIHTDNVSL